MKLTTTPFHPLTGELRPAYRDAYLRGDLSDQRAAEVDDYLSRHAAVADATLMRYYELRHAGHQVRPVGWVARQFELLRTQPKRIRQRAMGVAAGGLLLSGMVLAASSNLPTTEEDFPRTSRPETSHNSLEATVAPAASATYLVNGRIIDEEGKPMAGATVLDRATGRGVSTNAEGEYQFRVPVGQTARLQYAYAGYQEEELSLAEGGEVSLTLVPADKEPTASKGLKRWWKRVTARL